MSATVLLLDPNDVTRALIKHHLCRAGYTVYEMSDDNDIQELHQKYHPSMIIVDESIELPNCTMQLPQLILTNFPQPALSQQRRAFLTKPVSANHLLSTVFYLSH